MAKIDELLNELCPEGVEWKKLGEVSSVMRGASPRPIKNFLSDKNDGIPWIKIGDADPKDKYIFSTAEFINKQGAVKSRFLKKGSFILSNSMSFGRPYILAIDGCIHDGWIAISNYESHINSDYMYYVLRTANVKRYWSMSANNGAVSNLNADIVRDTIIPIPPLSIQQEIVEVLDTFTDAISNLEEELALREKQFEYYREQLLSCLDKSNRKMMCELFDMKAGKFISASQISNVKTDIFQYPCYGGNGLRGYVAKNNKDGEYVLVGRQGALCGNVCYVNESFYATEHAVVVADKGCCIPRYTFHLLTFADLNQYKTSGAQPGLSVSRLEKIELYVPSIERQQEIVEILDTFEAMIANIKEEIALRTKQYEYYREKLLSFGK